MPTETKGTTAIANVMEDLYYVAAVHQPLAPTCLHCDASTQHCWRHSIPALIVGETSFHDGRWYIYGSRWIMAAARNNCRPAVLANAVLCGREA